MTYECQIHCEEIITIQLAFQPLTDKQNIMPHEMYIMFIQKGKHYPAMDIQIECAPAAAETWHVKDCMLKTNIPHR
jgi:hypothetical protein